MVPPLALSFQEEIVVRLITAIFTALIVTIGAGVISMLVQRRIEQSKAERERRLDERWASRERKLDERWADRERSQDERWKASEREAEQRRADYEYERELSREERSLRRELVQRASEVLGGFYFATQSYWRQTQHESVWGAPDASGLDAAYLSWAKSADVFERDVAAIFGWQSTPWTLVHQCRDLLTMRYFDLRGRGTDALRANNAMGKDGGFHTGLTADDLKNDKAVLRTYRESMNSLVGELLTVRLVDNWPTEAAAKRS